MPTFRRTAVLLWVAWTTLPAVAADVTGRWRSDDGGTYFVRQIGDEVWWYGESGDGARGWANVLHGTIDGRIITATWADVPRGSAQSSGTITLFVDGDTIERRSGSGGFGGTRWTRLVGDAAVLPLSPSQSSGEPCRVSGRVTGEAVHFASAVRAIDPQGRSVASGRIAGDGRFAFTVPRGAYRVEAVSAGTLELAGSVSRHVACAGAPITVELQIDAANGS
jgi:hypothetical protein